MYYLFEYDYDNSTNKLLSTGYKRDIQEYIEVYILDFIESKQGKKYKSFEESCKKDGISISKDEWDNNIRFFCNKSKNNMHKYTVKQMVKNKGYIYNSYEIKKVKSIYISKGNDKFVYKENRDQSAITLETLNKFQEVLENITKKEKVKVDEKYYCKDLIYKDVVAELKDMFN